MKRMPLNEWLLANHERTINDAREYPLYFIFPDYYDFIISVIKPRDGEGMDNVYHIELEEDGKFHQEHPYVHNCWIEIEAPNEIV